LIYVLRLFYGRDISLLGHHLGEMSVRAISLSTKELFDALRDAGLTAGN